MSNICTDVTTEMRRGGYVWMSAQWSLDAVPLAAAGWVQGGSPGQSLLCRVQGSTCIITELENTMLLSGKSDTLFFQCKDQRCMQRHRSKLFCPLNHRHELIVTNYLDHECYVSLIL